MDGDRMEDSIDGRTAHGTAGDRVVAHALDHFEVMTLFAAIFVDRQAVFGSLGLSTIICGRFGVPGGLARAAIEPVLERPLGRFTPAPCGCFLGGRQVLDQGDPHRVPEKPHSEMAAGANGKDWDVCDAHGRYRSSLPSTIFGAPT
jgi:hypothetical protein